MPQDMAFDELPAAVGELLEKVASIKETLDATERAKELEESDEVRRRREIHEIRLKTEGKTTHIISQKSDGH